MSMAAVALAFAAWAFPSFGVLRKGFERAAPLDPVAILILVAWYSVVFCSFRVGEFFGTSQAGSPPKPFGATSLDADLPYYLFTIIATVGVVAACAKALGSLSLQGIFAFAFSGQANELKEAILDEYHVGILSLRYIAVYPAVIALYRLATRRRLSISIVVNLLLLLVTVFITGRLLLILGLMTLFLVMNYNVKYRNVNMSKLLVAAMLLFSLLAVFNYSRNLGFYEDRELGFWSAGLAEIITYLGCTTQIQLGTAARTSDIVSGSPEHYRDLVDIEEQVNTPSAFVALHQQMGYLCWFYMAVICSVSGFVFTRLVAKGATIYLLPAGSILYASAEIWRLNFFGLGIFMVLIVVGMGVPWFVSALSFVAEREKAPA